MRKGRQLFPLEGHTREVTATSDSGEWRERAVCCGADVSVFFSPEGERGHARDRREAQARQVCQLCPVLAQCRDHALTVGEPYGVWGGMTEGDRRKHVMHPHAANVTACQSNCSLAPR
ncbi:WhiB family transcriptional regulator [Rhodococcus sp. A14]|uniref:WhiB family transcriptional regulator n=1 Tax=Rhodococcus sp. A14 TaxID=1194106 RepID=UPI001424420F|nr:WhiB family transcriptional regulator [Rhodococcus sp. A14]